MKIPRYHYIEKKINLVDNGIFPIIYDKNGNLIDKKLDTNLKHPGSLQGEGKLVGTPSLIIRTSGCNLRCCWLNPDNIGDMCDTSYASWKPEKNLWEINDVITTIKNNLGNIKHIIITGGEPLLQPVPLGNLMKELKKLDLHITLETNGTLYDNEIIEYTDLISISPKLSNSIPWKVNLINTGYEYIEKRALKHAKSRINLRAIQEMIDKCYYNKNNKTETINYNDRSFDKDFQLKFVVTDLVDVEEIKDDFLKYLRGVKNNDIFLMPLGSNRDCLEKTTKAVMSEVIKNNWKFSPRLHIDLFDKKRNV